MNTPARVPLTAPDLRGNEAAYLNACVVENCPVGAEIGPPRQLIRGFAHVTEWHLEEAN